MSMLVRVAIRGTSVRSGLSVARADEGALCEERVQGSADDTKILEHVPLAYIHGAGHDTLHRTCVSGKFELCGPEQAHGRFIPHQFPGFRPLYMFLWRKWRNPHEAYVTTDGW